MFQLNSLGIINSTKDGHPDFVRHDYLNAITSETSVTALELEAAGLWERRDGGQVALPDPRCLPCPTRRPDSVGRRRKTASRG